MVRASFILQKISTKVSTGHAVGDHWYLVPLCLWKRRVFGTGKSGAGTQIKLSFDYALGTGQYLGTMLAYAGKEVWRWL